jgi:hypothetical protein
MWQPTTDWMVCKVGGQHRHLILSFQHSGSWVAKKWKRGDSQILVCTIVSALNPVGGIIGSSELFRKIRFRMDSTKYRCFWRQCKACYNVSFFSYRFCFDLMSSQLGWQCRSNVSWLAYAFKWRRHMRFVLCWDHGNENYFSLSHHSFLYILSAIGLAVTSTRCLG